MFPFLLPPVDVEWATSYRDACERAAEEERVVLVAVHSDGEARSEAFWDLYDEGDVGAALESTVNLVACLDAYGRRRSDCAKRADLDKEQAQLVEAALREEVLLANEDGVVASPQHLWLSPAGEVLLCAPYELTPGELLWCFAEAERLLGRDVEHGDRRAPRRLLHREAYRPAEKDELGRGLRPEELDEKLAELKSGTGGRGGRFSGGRGGRDPERRRILLQVAFTDEPDAQEHVALEVQSGWIAWRQPEVQARFLHTVALLAPSSAWEVFEDFADHREAFLRNECAVAVEQIGFEGALRTVEAALRREENPQVRKNWLRALGAVAGGDRGARRVLLETARDEDDEDGILRRNATFALGWLTQDEDVRAHLLATLEAENGDDARAAACAMALSRDARYLATLREHAGQEGLPEALRDALVAAAEVIEGASLTRIEDAVREACRDQIARERLFFRVVPAEFPGRGR